MELSIMDDYFEKLVQNVQKGEMYKVKLRNDSQTYLAIPMIPGRFQNENPPKFLLKVVAPEADKGVYEHLVGDIELLERKV